MIPFLHKLWQSPAGKSLTALLTVTVGIVVIHLTGPSGEVRLPAKIATELLLLTGGLLFSVCGVAYSYWKRCQPEERIDRARKAGRPICDCTEVGEIMLIIPSRSTIYHK